MKIQKSEAKRIKYEALWWLRFEQRCAFIATEVGMHSADVLGVNEKKLVEVEVKTNLADLKKDFSKPKHYSYTRSLGFSHQQQWVPTHFYYALPPDLISSAAKLLVTHGCQRYGIINTEGPERKLQVIKKADWLHKEPPNSHVKFVIGLRMGSELIRFHEAWI